MTLDCLPESWPNKLRYWPVAKEISFKYSYIFINGGHVVQPS